MPYIQDEIDNMLRLQTQYDEMIEGLTSYCRVIARALGYDDTCGVWAGTTGTGDQITFMAEWHGPYQAEDRESFAFPSAWLLKPPEEVAVIMVAERTKRNIEAKQLQDYAITERQRQEYLALKEKFEPT